MLSLKTRRRKWVPVIEKFNSTVLENRIYGHKTMRVQDRLKANAFEMQVGGVMHLALFPEANRINHDCAPKYLSPPFPKLIFAYQYFKNEVN